MDNKEEFVKIIHDNEALIVKVTRIYCDTKEDREDLFQDIVYQLWKSFNSFRNEAKISTWIYRVALNTSITHLNKKKRRGSHLPLNEGLSNLMELSDTLAEERSELLFATIKKFNEVEKGILFLFLEGKSYAEISDITGFSVSNVGTRMGRLKQKLITHIKMN